MGEHATAVQERLREALAAERPGFDWQTEYAVAGTPVDVAGAPVDVGGAGGDADAHLALVELEWRRADPADNTAKLFRHLDAGEFDAARVTVCQVFTGYYDLASGGVSSKRQNTEFVGRVAADALDAFEYHPVELPVDPPKRGGEMPDDWEGAVDGVAETVAELLA